MRPVNSSHSTISLVSTGATVTEGSIGFCCAMPRPQPEAAIIKPANRTALANNEKNLFFIIQKLEVGNFNFVIHKETTQAANPEWEEPSRIRFWRAVHAVTACTFSTAKSGKTR